MKNYTLLFAFLFFLLLSHCLHAQGWQRLYPYEGTGTVAHDVKQTADGGYVMVGNADFPTGAIRFNIRMTKTDAEGNVQWDKVFQEYDIRFDRGHEIWPTADGGYVIGGATDPDPFLGSSMFLMKIDAFGDSLWTRSYPPLNGSTAAYAAHPTPDGGFILAGEHYEGSVEQGNTYPVVVKTDANGEEEWTKEYLNRSD